MRNLPSHFKNLYPLSDNVLARARKWSRDLCLYRTSAVLESNISSDSGSVPLQDIVTHVREYIVAIGNVEEAPMRIAK